MIDILVRCHTPEPFSIKEWNVEVPSPLVMAHDLNHGLLDHNIIEGEELSFGFDCELTDAARGSGIAKTHSRQSILRVVLQDGFGKTFVQVLPFNLQHYSENALLEKEYLGSKNVSAELNLSTDEGLVGSTLHLTYVLDLSSLQATLVEPSAGFDSTSLLFIITCDEEMDWIVGGKVSGKLLCSDLREVSLDFWGIPTRPGFIKNFPKIFLEYDRSVREPPTISVQSKHPELFTSLSFANHMALACAAETESSYPH
jgi:hypothetical protein